MRVEFAPPGTDPTRMPSAPTRDNPVGGFLQSNGLLIAGVLVFLVITAYRFGWFEAQDVSELPDPVAAEVETSTVAPVDPGYCLYLDTIVITEGATVNVGGTREVTCFHGDLVVAELAP